jgi:hypothetical protein
MNARTWLGLLFLIVVVCGIILLGVSLLNLGSVL